MDFEIRSARPDDIEELARLAGELDRLHTEAHPQIFQGQAPRRLEDVESRIGAPDQTLLVAQRGGDLLGFIRAVKKATEPNAIFRARQHLVIDELFIAASARRQGLARSLFEAAIAWGRAQGLREVEVHVYEFNIEARALYDKLGFALRSRKLARRIDP